ncbi:Spy/CpxP family protein refolding chaperone [Sinorhizobium kostiense]|nr:Spy/CpxP family protein refolding chaperone [Sinorhizobium kostiense]
MKRLMTALIAILMPLTAVAESAHVHSSPYAGQEHRPIKSLSPEDIAELENGGGWGLAKAAELNGIPGPSHVLKMKDDLDLTAEQEEEVTSIFEHMRSAAVSAGKGLIAGERALETAFRERSIDRDGLWEYLHRIEASRAKLRYAHLAAHLEMVRVLSAAQIDRYNELRGYSR